MNRSTPKHIIVKMFNDEDKWLKAAGEKWLILYKRTLIGVTVDFLSETMEARRQSAGRENKSATNLTFSKITFWKCKTNRNWDFFMSLD